MNPERKTGARAVCQVLTVIYFLEQEIKPTDQRTGDGVETPS